jgi:hypothetical protein
MAQALWLLWLCAYFCLLTALWYRPRHRKRFLAVVCTLAIAFAPYYAGYPLSANYCEPRPQCTYGLVSWVLWLAFMGPLLGLLALVVSRVRPARRTGARRADSQ